MKNRVFLIVLFSISFGFSSELNIDSFMDEVKKQSKSKVIKEVTKEILPEVGDKELDQANLDYTTAIVERGSKVPATLEDVSNHLKDSIKYGEGLFTYLEKSFDESVTALESLSEEEQWEAFNPFLYNSYDCLESHTGKKFCYDMNSEMSMVNALAELSKENSKYEWEQTYSPWIIEEFEEEKEKNRDLTDEYVSYLDEKIEKYSKLADKYENEAKEKSTNRYRAEVREDIQALWKKRSEKYVSNIKEYRAKTDAIIRASNSRIRTGTATTPVFSIDDYKSYDTSYNYGSFGIEPIDFSKYEVKVPRTVSGGFSMPQSDYNPYADSSSDDGKSMDPACCNSLATNDCKKVSNASTIDTCILHHYRRCLLGPNGRYARCYR